MISSEAGDLAGNYQQAGQGGQGRGRYGGRHRRGGNNIHESRGRHNNIHGVNIKK
jgi:hypothetical protein